MTTSSPFNINTRLSHDWAQKIRNEARDGADKLAGQRGQYIRWAHDNGIPEDTLQAGLDQLDAVVTNRRRHAGDFSQDKRGWGLQFAKPARIDAEMADIDIGTHWVAVEEHLEQASVGGVALLNKDHTVFGRVLKAGPDADGIKAGDEIVYEEWKGGRWAIGGTRCLIMSSTDVLLRIEG